MSISDEVRRYWDEDSAVYDSVPHHHPIDPGEQAAWSAALADLLPPAPARILDCGAGTGFLALNCARLGHRVTALDISPGMLQRLEAKAEANGLEIEIVEGAAERPPSGPFDVVMERHLVWTLPDPVTTLRAWRAVAPDGRLVLFEGIWGSVDPVEQLRRSARGAWSRVSRLRGTAPAHRGHHAEYPSELCARMPLGAGTTPEAVVEVVRDAGWPAPRLHRLRDIEWVAARRLPLVERVLGVPPRFVVVAGN